MREFVKCLSKEFLKEFRLVTVFTLCGSAFHGLTTLWLKKFRLRARREIGFTKLSVSSLLSPSITVVLLVAWEWVPADIVKNLSGLTRSRPLTILKVSIKSPLARLSTRVGKFMAASFSSYVPLMVVIAATARRWTSSSTSMSCCRYGLDYRVLHGVLLNKIKGNVFAKSMF